ncbi:hypothetical protein Y032_0004g1831 [Ancylostoma ceylanicum]|uniref:Uncharacterized protein n=1 Tax=Ancylostoma ceylanicum TaxID=53326 RepID=A0A016VTG0_9BILA|nr:hypothetical protein Y032_0004g1831 [Ancylostoma ceylanicum]
MKATVCVRFYFRILPERWVNFLDPYLYPTCPAKPPPPVVKESNETEELHFFLKYIKCEASNLPQRPAVQEANLLMTPRRTAKSVGSQSPHSVRVYCDTF